jgi:hypothetical protein
MLNFLKRNQSTLRTVFDNKQISRMKQIGVELSKLETLEKAKPNAKIELQDWASKTTETVARLVGAEIGGKTGGSMGGSLQHAQIVSGKARQLMNKLNLDKAQQLVQDAILSDDPSLLKSLLAPLQKPKPNKKDLLILNKKLNAWLLSTGQRVMQDMEPDEPQIQTHP